MDPTRAARLRYLGARRFDLLVIGGGITGAGIARDAALRGLTVALVERADIAGGTSSRSSRLIHGGVRYLEHGHLKLVLEASRERRRLLRLAPHLVRPLEFVWPVYAGARVPRWKLRAGLFLYDLLAAFRNVHPHRGLGAPAILDAVPGLRAEGLRGGASYWDASTDDARLTLATALDAESAGAAIVTHAEVTALEIAGGAVGGARVRDALDGAEVIVRARVTVNATGPWSDSVRRLEGAAARPSIRASRGSHIAVDAARLPIRVAVTLLSPVDGRVFFALPAGVRTIIGTTDEFTNVSADEVRATTGDIDYLLRSANHFFPSAALTGSDVRTAWAGLRPLIAGTGTEQSSSREHVIASGPAGMLTITGGKLTTYRVMAADVTDAVVRRLGRKPERSPTRDRPLPGGDFDSLEAETAAAARETGDRARAEVLVAAYGAGWREIAASMNGDRMMAERVIPERPEPFAMLVHGIDREHAATLGDLLIRRTRIAWVTGDQGRAAARRTVDVLGERRGWDPSLRARLLSAYEAEVANLFGVDPAIRRTDRRTDPGSTTGG